MKRPQLPKLFKADKRYSEYIDPVVRAGANDDQLFWFKRRFINQLRYHTRVSHRNKGYYLLIASASFGLPVVANMVMSISIGRMAVIGAIVGLVAIGIVSLLGGAQAILNPFARWQRSRALAEDLKRAYFTIFINRGDKALDDVWGRFTNAVESYLEDEQDEFGQQSLTSHSAVERATRRAMSRIDNRAHGVDAFDEPWGNTTPRTNFDRVDVRPEAGDRIPEPYLKNFAAAQQRGLDNATYDADGMPFSDVLENIDEIKAAEGQEWAP